MISLVRQIHEIEHKLACCLIAEPRRTVLALRAAGATRQDFTSQPARRIAWVAAELVADSSVTNKSDLCRIVMRGIVLCLRPDEGALSKWDVACLALEGSIYSRQMATLAGTFASARKHLRAYEARHAAAANELRAAMRAVSGATDAADLSNQPAPRPALRVASNARNVPAAANARTLGGTARLPAGAHQRRVEGVRPDSGRGERPHSDHQAIGSRRHHPTENKVA